jgi:hypothetical protein
MNRFFFALALLLVPEYVLAQPAPNFCGGTIVAGDLMVAGNSAIPGCLVDSGLSPTGILPETPLNRNPEFSIDQPNEGTTIALSGQPVFLIDGWHGYTNLGGHISTARVLSNSAGPPGYVSFWSANQTSSLTLSASIFSRAITNLEGSDVAPLLWGTAAAEPLSVDVCLFANNAGTYSAFLANSSGTLSYILDFSMPLPNAWQCFHQTVPGPTTGSWNNTANSIGLVFGFNFFSGTTYQTTGGAWQSGAYYSDGSTTQLVTTGMALDITALHIYPGSIARPYQPRSIAQELAFDSRFARKSFPIGTRPVQNSGVTRGAVALIAPFAQATSGTVGAWVGYPAMYQGGGNIVNTFYSPSAATANCYDVTKTTDAGAAGVVNQGDTGMLVECTLASGDTLGDLLQVHYLIDTGT